ncbi:hypothetical protein Tco_0426590, partial [Tanacetum coccineum]
MVRRSMFPNNLKRELHDLRDSFMGDITKIREEFGEEVSTLHQTIENLQADVALCKRSLASSGSNINHGPKIDVPKPSILGLNLWRISRSNSIQRILRTRRRVGFVNLSNPGRYGST